MKPASLLLTAGAVAALAACASHSAAPVVYGTQPSASGRIYNSPADYSRENPPVRQASYDGAPESTRVRPAPLTPVAATIYEDEVPPAPTYISSPSNASARRAAPHTVTVQPGDTVYAIGRRTGASPQTIIAENSLRAPYTLAVGETLRVPDPGDKIVNTIAQPNRTPMREAVRERARATAPQGKTMTVRPGDTLYSISRSTGASVQALASANRLSPPYELQIGEALHIPSGGVTIEREARAPTQDVAELARNVSYTNPASEREAIFEWPVKGAIIGEYGAGSNGRRNDGVNIAAPVGTPVRAAADGEVVYRGAELDGYGNLLLLKHEGGFVTAYAHNDVMLVKKGQKVRKGEAIAKVGQTGAATEPQLHFEIRRNLQSVDPIALLEK